MGSLFSRKKKTRVTEQDEAVLQLKSQRDKLKQYQRKVETNMDRERTVAKQLIKDGKKDKALLLLKKKKFQESMIEKTVKQLEQLERLVHDVEFAQIEAQVMESLKAGNESLRKMHRLMSIEDVEKILEDTRESVEYQNEIDSLISGELNDVDMGEIEEELEEILRKEREEQEEQEPVPALPDVPQEELPKIPAEKKPRRAEPQMVPA